MQAESKNYRIQASCYLSLESIYIHFIDFPTSFEKLCVIQFYLYILN